MLEAKKERLSNILCPILESFLNLIVINLSKKHKFQKIAIEKQTILILSVNTKRKIILLNQGRESIFHHLSIMDPPKSIQIYIATTNTININANLARVIYVFNAEIAQFDMHASKWKSQMSHRHHNNNNQRKWP